MNNQNNYQQWRDSGDPKARNKIRYSRLTSYSTLQGSKVKNIESMTGNAIYKKYYTEEEELLNEYKKLGYNKAVKSLIDRWGVTRKAIECKLNRLLKKKSL